MSFKKIVILVSLFPLVFLVLFLFPIYKIASAVDTAGDPNPDVPTTYVGNQQIQNIKKLIGENTPGFIAKPIIKIANASEGWRKEMSAKTEGKVYSIIFDNGLVFYGIFVVIFGLILRSFWRMIF